MLVAAVALVDTDGRVLLAQRPAGKSMAGLWEFPGGKVNAGETPEAALIRELAEELGIEVRASSLAPLTFVSHAYPRFHLLMPLYLCREWSRTPMPREGQRLGWVWVADLSEYPMPPADLPLVARLRQEFGVSAAGSAASGARRGQIAGCDQLDKIAFDKETKPSAKGFGPSVEKQKITEYDWRRGAGGGRSRTGRLNKPERRD